MDRNALRKEAYRYYRSIGYTVKEATNARNKSVDRLVREFKSAMVDYNEKRIEGYKSGERIPLLKPYRPTLQTTEKTINNYCDRLVGFGVSGDVVAEMVSKADPIAMDIYERRLSGLELWAQNKGVNFKTWLETIQHFDNLSDFWDAIGDWYDLING
jgi:hypothetical protein